MVPVETKLFSQIPREALASSPGPAQTQSPNARALLQPRLNAISPDTHLDFSPHLHPQWGKGSGRVGILAQTLSLWQRTIC